MGCDIHVSAEVKIDDQWHHYECLDVGRDYQLFGRMAGVRNKSEEPISLPKGMPKDCSALTKIIYESDCYHTHSYLNKEEIEILNQWMKNQYYSLKWIDYLIDECKCYEFEEYRIVFAFDN